MAKHHRDPTDHSRTSYSRAGEWFKNSRDLLGLFLLAAGVVGVPVCLAAAAHGNRLWAIGTGAAAALAFCGGTAWLFVEGRRIKNMETQFHTDRREQRALAVAETAATDSETRLPA